MSIFAVSKGVSTIRNFKTRMTRFAAIIGLSENYLIFGGSVCQQDFSIL
jgi:hypothetical protein